MGYRPYRGFSFLTIASSSLITGEDECCRDLSYQSIKDVQSNVTILHHCHNLSPNLSMNTDNTELVHEY